MTRPMSKKEQETAREEELIRELEEERLVLIANPERRQVEPRKVQLVPNPDIAETLGRILSRFHVGPELSPYKGPCGLDAWDGEAITGEVYCHSGQHFTQDPNDPNLIPGKPSRFAVVIGKCPAAIAAERREKMSEEEKRLGRRDFISYDPRRNPQGHDALSAVRSVSETGKGRVLLSGQCGLGKSHLLIASHLSLIADGKATAYLSAENDMRPLFRSLAAYDGEEKATAEHRLRHLARVPFLHLDELARVDGNRGYHAEFRAGLLRLLDLRAQQNPNGARVVAMNVDDRQAIAHPDIGTAAFSRLCEGATVIRMTGRDQRIARMG